MNRLSASAGAGTGAEPVHALPLAAGRLGQHLGAERVVLPRAVAHALALSLFMRYRSRQDDSFSAKVLAALRNEFGGHPVKMEDPPPRPSPARGEGDSQIPSPARGEGV